MINEMRSTSRSSLPCERRTTELAVVLEADELRSRGLLENGSLGRFAVADPQGFSWKVDVASPFAWEILAP